MILPKVDSTYLGYLGLLHRSSIGSSERLTTRAAKLLSFRSCCLLIRCMRISVFFTIGKVVKVRNVSGMKMSEEQRARYYSAKYLRTVKYNRCYCKVCFVGGCVAK